MGGGRHCRSEHICLLLKGIGITGSVCRLGNSQAARESDCAPGRPARACGPAAKRAAISNCDRHESGGMLGRTGRGPRGDAGLARMLHE